MFARKHFSLLTICFLLLAQNLFSQIVLEGVVTDNGAEYLGNGAESVAGALVTLTDQADAQRTFTAYTDDQGHYSIEITATGVDEPDANNPGNFMLHQNYPNPFNPSTVIGYKLYKASHITIDIYNVLGQKVRTLLDGYQTAGPGQVMWDAANDMGQGVPAGVYIYSLRSDGVNVNKKMLLIDGRQGSAHTVTSNTVEGNISDVHAVKKQLSDQYTMTVTGNDIAAYEQQNLEITGSMTVDVTVSRTVTDIDGNVYTTVKIGDQWWMAENFKVTHYRNGEEIPEVTDNTSWANLSTGARCVYDNTESNADTYGYLYNWYAVNDSRNIAPEGWHVPAEEEWKTLEKALGMSQSEADDEGWRGTNEGSKMADNADLWFDGDLENNGAFGESGFSALPGGFRSSNGSFNYLGYVAYFWSATEDGTNFTWSRNLSSDDSEVNRFSYDKPYGFSVRLVRDN